MGIFFMSEPISLTVNKALEEAMQIDPKAISNLQQEVTRRAKQVTREISGLFIWGRFVVAIILLVAIFGAGIYTTLIDLEDWSKVLLHSFELVLGLVLGLLGGEAAAKR
jgi:hypothetical protein